MLKRVLIVIAIVVLVPVLVLVGAVAITFAGNPPIVDGQELGSGIGRVVKDGYVSVTVIDNGDGTVSLVDAGASPDAKAVLAELARRHLTADAVRAIFLTHGHPDHTAGCPVFSKAQVYALAADVPLAEGHARSHGPVSQLMPPKDLHVHVSQALVDGQQVVVGKRTFHVFAVPGHTPGSAAYLVDGLLFLGDSADATKDGRLVSAKRIVTDDHAQNVQSLKQLAQRLHPQDVTTLVSAHTGTLAGLQPLTDFAARE